MALNQAKMTVDYLYIAVQSGAVSGDPLKVGFIVGVCQTDRDSAGKATIAIKPSSVWDVSVQAVTTAGSPGAGSAVAVGDKLFVDANKIVSKDTAGVLFGYALEAITSGATDTINVLLA